MGQATQAVQRLCANPAKYDGILKSSENACNLQGEML